MATISNNEIKIKYSLDTTDLANATALFDRLSAEDRQLLNDLKKLQAQLTATGQAGTNAGQNISRATRQANDDTVKLGISVKQIGAYIATAFSIQTLIQFGKSVLDTTIKMEGLRKAIEFTSKSVIGGQANLEFLRQTAEKFGIPLEAAAEGFKSLSAAAGRANITMQMQRQMFTDLSAAMSALSLTSQDASLVFFGFGQLLSKNKVSAQELYHQIGERLPLGMEAAQIAAAKVTGQLKVTGSELIKLVEDGKLMSSEFAPAFTEALGQLAASGAYVDTLGKDVTRLSNAWEEFKTALGDNKALGFVVNSMKEWVVTLNRAADVIGYYLGFKFLDTGKTLSEYNQFQNELISIYDGIVNSAELRFEDLNKLNSEYLKALTDQSTSGQKKQKEIEAQYAQERKDVVNELSSEIKRREQDILNFKKDILEKEKAIRNADYYDISSGRTALYKKIINQNNDNIKKAEAALKALNSLFGTVPQLNTLLPDPEAEKKKEKELENLYKILIDQQEALMKAEEDRIKSRTTSGTNQDVLLIQNRIKFNEKMLEIDQRAEFQKLELAKNNAVKRQGLLEKERNDEEEIIRQVRFQAFAAEKEYLDKSLEVIQDAQRKRRQAIQTDEQNELEVSTDFYEDKLKVLTDAYKKNIKLEGLQKEDLQKLEWEYYRAKLELTEDGEKAALDIKAKYRAKEKAERTQAEFEIRSTLVEAASIRNQALVKSESEKAEIAEEAAITQIRIEKEKNNELRIENENNSTLSVAERKNLNDKLEAQDVLLDARLTEVLKQGEQRRLEEREDKAKMVMEIGQTLADGLFQIYNQQLSNELTALNNKYNEEVRLADGNKQKLAQLEQDKREAEKEIRIKQFRADQAEATAKVIFATATQLMSSALNPAMIPYIIGLSVAQLAMIAAQPVPEFAEGTKGKKFKGGPAIVGERGVEKVITESGKVYFTPDHASLVELPKGSQVIPNHALSKRELFWANAINNGKPIPVNNGLERKLDEIGGILRELPVHQIYMDEKGFEKYIRTPRRSTKILNNRFGVKS